MARLKPLLGGLSGKLSKSSGIHSVRDVTDAVMKGLSTTPSKQVLVGIPEEKTEREEGGMTNAALGYIHENGAPEINLPPRPHLLPGIRAVKDKVAGYLRQAAQATVDGDEPRSDRALNAAGMVAMNSVQRILSAGVPPPLKDSTLKRRARRRGKGHRIAKGAVLELEARAAGAAPGVSSTKPLIDSGQLLRSYTYVLRETKK